jgi:EAL domain-containing protein (putative c-di-GMP-specific phosphodiesterase class I)
VSTPSLGIVVFGPGDHSIDDLLKKADVAMYEAKAAGRNTSRFFDPRMQASVSAHAALEKELRKSLERGGFLLHYQVQVDGDSHITGVEALVRWQHPVRGLVPPGEFIPLAEESGLILPLGQWVLEAACAQLVRWSTDPVKSEWVVAVNVSAVQFAQANFVEQVRKALAKTGALAQRLKIEITESMLMNNVEEIIEKMGAIKSSGVRMSLDDFGTGYSSLSYLKRLPLDQLKIDQSFVRDLLTDPNDAVIAKTVVALGHSLGLKVIAEGVETAQQRDLLLAMGCDAFQGYHFGRPVPAEQL